MGLKLVEIALTLLCVSKLGVHSAPSATGDPILNTRLGKILGTRENVIPAGRSFLAFRGIPYAKPPVGDLRWKDPVPYGQLTAPLFNATKFGSLCPQYNLRGRRVVGKEDCLYLNVYTPKAPERVFERESDDDDYTEDENDSVELQRKFSRFRGLPVMVWVHGGGFIQGSAQNLGPEFLLREDIVLVTVNYRLGALGFLSTGDETLPGNFGSLDMVEALKWVRRNIRDFGGNPWRVTIFGESAGGASTHLLSLSPLTRGLVHKMISMSGVATCEWAVNKKPLDFAKHMATRLDCPKSDKQELVKCLRTKNIDDLVLASYDPERYNFFPLVATPVVDKASRDNPFLPDAPINLIKKKQYRPIPMMVGLVEDESLFFLMWTLFENLGRISSPWFLEKSLLPGIVDSVLKNRQNYGTVVQAIKQKYFNGVSFKDFSAVFPRFSKMLDDLIFTSGTYEAQLLHAKDSPVYAYVFDYRGEQVPPNGAPFIDILRRAGIDHPLISTGVSHFDEIYYLFTVAGANASYSKTDMDISVQMTKLWASFATTGMPTPTVMHYDDDCDDYYEDHQHEEWYPIPVHSKGDVPYYRIGAKSQMLSSFRKEEHAFWTKEIPQLRSSNISVPLECYEAPCNWD